MIADRFLDSTTIYQGVARGSDKSFLRNIHNFTVGDYYPDCTFLLDISVEEGRKRIASRSGGELDRMEREPDSFFEKVRSGYLNLADSEPERFEVLDASLSVDVLEVQIWETLVKRYGLGS